MGKEMGRGATCTTHGILMLAVRMRIPWYVGPVKLLESEAVSVSIGTSKHQHAKSFATSKASRLF